MNQFFYETRGRERLSELMKEGLESQAFQRLTGPRLPGDRRLLRLALAVMGILGMMGLPIG
jgi:hypothetical protein